MEFTYQASMQLPAAYAVLSEEEMVYIEGGALSLNISQEQVMTFTVNVIINSIRMLGQGAIGAAVSGIQNMRNDGLSTWGAVRHFWGRQTPVSKTLTVVAAGFAGVYVYYQAVSIFNTFLTIYNDVKNAYNEDQAAKADAAASANTALAAA